MSQSDSNTEIDLLTNSYDSMLETLNNAIGQMIERIENGRIRNVEIEKVRIKQYQALAYLIRTKQGVLEEKTLDDLAEEIEALKEKEERTEDND